MAIIGLGKMGKELAMQALKKKLNVVGLTVGKVPKELVDEGLEVAQDLEDLIVKMESPRKIFIYVPSGPVVEDYIQRFSLLLSKGDIVVDGGNSYWGDSLRRAKLLESKGIDFIDLGTSGGITGAKTGACFMAGGKKEIYEKIIPVLEKISAPGAFAYVGPSGSGHLVKLIHNGIEFGMLQAIGEGMALLKKFKHHLDISMEGVFQTYKNGSVIRSWLIELMAEQYEEKKGFADVPAYIEDTGEVNWLVSDALHLEVPVPIISQSVMELFRSRDKEGNDYKAVAMMRHGFGGHPFGESSYHKMERVISRISPDFPEDLHEQ